MNIKIENDVRIRMTQQEYQLLQADKEISKDFKMGGLFQFTVHILKSPLNTSSLTESANKIQLSIAAEDLQQLAYSEQKKKGINIGTYNLQVDLFKEK